MLEALLHTATSNMRIKLLTLNIEHGGKLFDNIVRLIEEQDPDIVLFQEVYDSNLQDRERRFRAFSEFGSIFKEKLPFKAFQSSCFFITEIDEGAEHGNCIYSKFEIKSNTKTELSVPYTIVDEKGTDDYSIHPAITQNLELIVDNQKLYVYNIHGVWGRDGLDSAARIEMAKRIASKIKGKTNVILAGDTNFTMDAKKTVQILEDAGVENIFGESLISTFNMKYKNNPGYATAAVDMIFTGKGIKIIEKECLDADVSDHFPLTATFESI